jgi:hypothetical protein
MAVAKFDRLGDFIHESLRSVDNDLIILKADDTVNRIEKRVCHFSTTLYYNDCSPVDGGYFCEV